MRSLSLVLSKWAWSRSREQFWHCGLRKFGHSKSSVYMWYTQLDRRRFVYDTYKTTKATRSHHGWVHMFITHWPTVTLQLHNFDLFRTCRTSSFCTVAWQLARFQLTRRIVRFLGDSWASWFDSRCTCGHKGSIWVRPHSFFVLVSSFFYKGLDESDSNTGQTATKGALNRI